MGKPFGKERMRELLPPDLFEYMDKEWKDMGGVEAFIDFVTEQTPIFGI